MDTKIVFGIIALVIAAIAATILLPGGRHVDEHPKLPWVINVDTQGHSEVFGLTLKKSLLNDAQNTFQQEPEVTLFRSPEGDIDIEAFFNNIFLSGLKATIILNMNVDETTANNMFDNGRRISQMGSGSKKVDLSAEDIERLGLSTFSSMTYLPAADLEPDLIRSHFGEPEEMIKMSEEVQHWLYPSKGLDIAIHANAKEVFQYVAPKDFDQVLAPLKTTTPRKEDKQ